MATFMEKLKGKGLVGTVRDGEAPAVATGHAPNAAPSDLPVHAALQLPIDVFQTDKEIVIFAQIAGVDLDSLDVSIGGDHDVVTISGSAKRPETLMPRTEGEYSLEECSWGDFYRQIILPEPIDQEKAEAKEKDGVLVLVLPLKDQHHDGVKMRVVRVE